MAEWGIDVLGLTSDGATLRAFTEAVMRAAEENVEEVVPVVLAVVGGVLSEAEPGSVAIEDAADGPGTLRATFAGRRAAFRYNVMTAMIEMHEGDRDEHPTRLFGRRSLAMDIVNYFGALRAERARGDGPGADG